MRELLDWIFIDLLEFHRRALMFFRKRSMYMRMSYRLA